METSNVGWVKFLLRQQKTLGVARSATVIGECTRTADADQAKPSDFGAGRGSRESCSGSAVYIHAVCDRDSLTPNIWEIFADSQKKQHL